MNYGLSKSIKEYCMIYSKNAGNNNPFFGLQCKIFFHVCEVRIRMLISNVELETSYQFRKCNFRNVDISDIGKPNTRSKKGKISIFIFSLQIIDLQSEMAVQ